jgi:integrase
MAQAASWQSGAGQCSDARLVKRMPWTLPQLDLANRRWREMYCRGCGIELTNPQRFCPKCGTTVHAEAKSPETETLSAGDVTGPGRVLHARFISLGNMTGKTTDLLGQSVSIQTVAALLGHSSTKITEGRYSHWIKSRQGNLEAEVKSRGHKWAQFNRRLLKIDTKSL